MATVPGTLTFTAGSILTASQLNTYLSTAVAFFIAPPLAILRQTVGQTYNNSAFTAITFDTEDIDRDGGHSTVTNTSRYTAQTAGWYDCSATNVWSTTIGTGWVGTMFQANGSSTTRSGGIKTASSTTFNTVQTIAIKYFLNVGDYLEVLAGNGTGTNSGSAGSDSNPRFNLQWIST